MTLVRCAVLLLCVLACGSPRSTPAPPSTAPRAPQGSGSESPTAPRPVALAVVVQGWEMWIGNDQLPGLPEHERYMGALRPFQEAFGQLKLDGLPAGSQAAVITYTEGATTRHAMQPIEALGPAAFGDQKDYAGVIDRDLVAGVALGLDELAKTTDRRRVLVVIGDGTATAPDKAKLELAELAKRAADENVEVVSLVYYAPLSSPAQTIRAFDPMANTVHSVDSLVDQLAFLLARLSQPPVVPGRTADGKGLVLAVLINGSEIWTGNDDFTDADDPSRYPGALHAIRAALDQAHVKSGLPAGSQAMLLTYASNARVRVPAMPIEAFDARAVGVQRDYYGALGSELVGGVTLAFAKLLEANAARRVLVVVGDGADTNHEAAKLQLQELAKRAAAHRIEVHAIVWKGQLSPPETVITELDPQARTVPTTAALTTALVEVLGKLR